MIQLQILFSETEKKQFEAKKIKADINEALKNNKKYQDLLQEMGVLRTERKQIEMAVNEEFSHEVEKLDNLKIDIKDKKVALCDVALSDLVAGKAIEVEDDKGRKYVPEFSVKFKKVK